MTIEKKLCVCIADHNALGFSVEGFHAASIEAVMEGDFPWSKLTGKKGNQYTVQI